MADHWNESPTSWRSSPRPRGWKDLRARVLTRDHHTCTWIDHDGHVCNQPATDVDHIGAPDDHGLGNLRALCGWHHRRRTAHQGGSARRQHPRRRPAEQHPGLRS